MTSPPFRVIPSQSATESMKALGRTAKAAGMFEEYLEVLRQIAERLQNEPLGWAGLPVSWKPEFTECFKNYRFLTLRYLVYEERGTVELLEVNALPGTALEQGHP
jgi:hypothetical protein